MLSVLVIGCGSIGQRHLRNLLALRNRGAGTPVTIGEIFAFDVDAGQRTKVQVDLGVAAFQHLEDAFQRLPSAVIIASPTDQHLATAIEAVRRGCHLFIEKPLSFSLDGVSELCAEIERRELTSMTACNMRFHPGPATVKSLLVAEAAGAPISARIHVGSYLPQWRSEQDYRRSYSASMHSGGAVLDCIHEIDLALWYFGPAKVVASAAIAAKALGLETDGLAEALLQHASGTLSSLHVNYVQRDYHRVCMVIGTKGTIYWNFTDGRVRLLGERGELVRTYDQPDNWHINQMYVDELNHFLRAVGSRRPTTYPVRASVDALHIALAIRESMDRGQA